MRDTSSMKSALLLCAVALSLHAQTGSLTIHMILHAIGKERYEITPAEGGLTLHTTLEYSDRGNQRTTTADLWTKADGTPVSLETKEVPNSVKIQGASANITEDASTRTFSPPERYFAVYGVRTGIRH
jgi:hypothetical protein